MSAVHPSAEEYVESAPASRRAFKNAASVPLAADWRVSLSDLGSTSLARARATVARSVAAAAFLVLTVFLIARQGDFLFQMSPRELSRARYGRNPFIESVAVAKKALFTDDPTKLFGS